MERWMVGDTRGGETAFGGMMMFLWFALLVGLIVLIVRWFGRTPKRKTYRVVLDTLQQQLACREVDMAEFENRSLQLRTSE